ncbi:flagellar hook-basal body complex protein FliE [Brevirhabdus sp.]|uniref:flagellar hook-basal body complex protein FliE n=1 Tax=Brevirhabdus sp. TaxID=2004514 RepID=UPI004059160B
MAEFTSLVSNAAASGAYRSARDIQGEATAGMAQAEPAGKVSFSELLANAGADAIDTVRKAEAVATQGLQGKAETQQVVEATLELESTVRVAVSVRDKLIEAYQEIMRMPI